MEIEALRKQIRELTTIAPGEGTGSVHVGEGGHHHTPPEIISHPSGSTTSTDPAWRLERTRVASREVGPRRILAESSRSSHRKGKAPPVDPFTGEDPEVRFVDWFPTLTWASRWNEWTPEESLMQLAGHLRGHALQEWALLEDREKNSWDGAVAALCTRLNPGNKVLAAQDFRHTMQKDAEVVADFVRRLERTFRIAYGNDRLSAETRKAFLYSQLQEGLRTDLMQNPSVSGALSYKTLCMAARNEEQRREEMKKRRNYRDGDHSEHKDLKRREVVQRSRVSSSYPKHNQQWQEGGSRRDASTPRPNEDTR